MIEMANLSQIKSSQSSGEKRSGIIVVIPTRNRSDFLANALRSLTAQGCNNRLDVFLSDNSTEPEEVRSNQRTFDSYKSRLRLSYIRPPVSMSMTEHWEWAMQRALSSGQGNHVLILTDRMFFKPGGVDRLVAVIMKNADHIIAYSSERINDYSLPVTYERVISTGRLFELPCMRMIELSSRMIFHEALPRMLNCVVPVKLLEDLRGLHGKYFDSISPDFNFCFRSLDIADKILFFDDPILVHYGIGRSNGAGVRRGGQSKDSIDFFSALATGVRFPLSPIPALITVSNGIAHEYNLVHLESCSSRFPPLDMNAYLAANEKECGAFSAGEARRNAMALIAGRTVQKTVLAALFARLRARFRSVIFRALTQRGGMTFATSREAIEFILGRLEGRSLLDKIRALPYRAFLSRLLRISSER